MGSSPQGPTISPPFPKLLTHPKEVNTSPPRIHLFSFPHPTPSEPIGRSLNLVATPRKKSLYTVHCTLQAEGLNPLGPVPYGLGPSKRSFEQERCPLSTKTPSEPIGRILNLVATPR
jgi:hypothetical protein